jgi:hypothetical protein
MSAGRDWFAGFMEGNSDISQRKGESLSTSRKQGVNRKQLKTILPNMKICTWI